MNTFDKMMDAASCVATGAAKQAESLVNKGCERAKQLSLQAKLHKRQRQLGAFVYKLHKLGQENEPMMGWYIKEIDKVKEELSKLEIEDSDVTILGADKGAEDKKDATFCGGDGH